MKLKRFTAVFLVLMILMSNFVEIFPKNIAYAQSEKQMKVTELKVEPSSIEYGGKFKISGTFGGQGYTANPGERLEVSFKTSGVDLQIQNVTKDLYEGEVKIGIARFSSSGIQIEFTEGVEGLEDVSGSFSIEGQANNTDTTKTNTGTIDISSGDLSKRIEVKYEHKESGTVTENVYSKQGVSDARDPDNVRWVFTLNAAKKDGSHIIYNITDTLNEDMDWNEDEIKKDLYFIRVTDKTGRYEYLNFNNAPSRGIRTNFDGKNVTIQAYGPILNQNQVEITLKAALTEKVKSDYNKKYVTNTSEVNILNDDENEWKIKEEDKTGKADVYHLDAEGQGGQSKYGKIKILKKDNQKGNPISKVKFEISKIDKTELKLSKDFNETEYIKLSKDKKQIVVETNKEGEVIVEGLGIGKYNIKEIQAPDFVDFDVNNSKLKEFEINSENLYIEKSISNNIKEISIPVKKLWKTNNQELTNIKNQVKIDLKDDLGNVVDTLELNGQKNNVDMDNQSVETGIWEGHFKKVPTHRYENGEWKEIKYTVEEQGAKDGTVVLDGDTYKVTVEEPKENNGQWEITNTRVTKITADKTWQKDGKNTLNNKKPSENTPDVYFKLQEKSSDNWIDTAPKQVIKYEGKRVEFENIDPQKEYRVVETKDADGKEEWKFEGYQTSQVKKEARTIEWNFTNNYVTTNVKVNKKWIGGPKVKPEVYFQLEKNGEKVEVEGQENPLLLAENQDSIEWTNLPKRDIDGKEIKYTVKEVKKEGRDWNDKNWESKLTSGSETNSGPFEFTNTNKENVEIYAKKIWKDGANDEHTAPKLKLTRSTSKDIKGEEVDIEAEVTPKGISNEFSYKWTNLPKYDENGKEYIYDIYEEGVRDGKYTVNKNGKNKEYSVSGPIGEGSKEKPFTITNAYTPGKISINATKVWQGGEGQDRPNVKFQLYKDGKPEGEPKEIVSPEVSVSWTNLEETKSDGTDYKYTVEEVDVPKNYEKQKKVEGDGTSENPFKITNKFIPTSVKVTKTWENVNSGEETPALYFQLMNGEKAVGDKKELANSEDTIVWNNLPKYDKGNKEINYTVKEVNQDGSDWEASGYTKGSIKGNKTDGFTVTNTKDTPWTPMEPPTREIKVTKEWKNHKGDNLEKVPVEEIEVQLYKDGVKEGKAQKLSKSNNWEYTFKNLKDYEKVGMEIKKHIYSIKEVHQGKELENSSSTKFDGKWFKVTYTGDMKDGFKITNEEEKPWTPIQPPTRNIKVVKNWDLLGTEKPVDKIEVELYKDGIATGKKVELNKENNWKGEFKNLEVAEKLGSTNYYNYTVKEVGESGNAIKLDGKWFKVTYTGDMKDGFKIINEEEKPDVPKPNEPEKPNKPNKPEKPTPNTPKEPSKNLPKTGDGFNPSVYAGIMVLAGGVLTLIGIKRRKKYEE